VPGAPVRVGHVLEGARERLVRGTAVGERRTPVDRGPDQRVPELHSPPVDLDDAGLLGRAQRRRLDTEPRRGAEHEGEPTPVVGRNDQQQPLCLRRQPADPVEEGSFDAGGQRQGDRKGGGAGQLSGFEGTRQLDEGERVAPDRSHEPLPYVGVDSSGAPHEQVSGLVGAEGRHVQRRQVGRGNAVRIGVANREHHRHWFGGESAGDEGQRGCRSAVEPVGVVEHAEHGPPLAQFRQEAERGKRDQEPVGASPAHAERHAERLGLGLGEAVGRLQHGPQQAVQGRVRQLRLRLDAAAPEHGHPVGARDQLVE
jgi:hypothetical protein